jgi:V8-like Glu-specific endopeptidase
MNPLSTLSDTRFHRWLTRSATRSVLGATLGLLTALFVAEPGALALPVGNEEEADEQENNVPSWEEIDATGVDFTAIVALSNCSGSLVRFTTSKTTDYAMVLTNGHCLSGFVAAGTALVDVPSSRTFTLLDASGRSKGTLRAQKMMYATMTGSDFALYQLSETYAQLSTKYRVTALTISSRRSTAGTSVRIPSGYWRKIYSCSIDYFVPKMKESSWTWTDSIRFTQPGCETIGGTSGSPIVDAETRAIIGINNTGNESGGMCTMNNPCEVDAAGNTKAYKGAAYGQQLYPIYSCLTSANQINLNQTGCTLQKPK